MNKKYILFLIIGAYSSALPAADAEFLENQSIVKTGLDVVMGQLSPAVKQYCIDNKIDVAGSLLPNIEEVFRFSDYRGNFRVACARLVEGFTNQIAQLIEQEAEKRKLYFEVFREELKKHVGNVYFDKAISTDKQQRGFECAYKVLKEQVFEEEVTDTFFVDFIGAAATLYGTCLLYPDRVRECSVAIPLCPDHFVRAVPDENTKREKYCILTPDGFNFPSPKTCHLLNTYGAPIFKKQQTPEERFMLLDEQNKACFETWKKSA